MKIYRFLYLVLAATLLAGNSQAQTWDSIGSGVKYGARSLATYNGDLVCSNFSGDVLRWNGSSWMQLGASLNSPINVLSEYQGKLIGGGKFSAYGLLFNLIVVWNDTTWKVLGGGMPLSLMVEALTIYNGNLIAGGAFGRAGGITTPFIAQWNGSNWDSLGSRLNGYVWALTVYNGNLIAAGEFDTAGGKPANNIAQWNGSSWSPLGAGTNNIIYALAVYNGKLIADGVFNMAGGSPANGIAEWNGSSWSPLGSGLNNANIASLAVYNGNLIAGGEFTNAGGNPIKYISQWDGSTWSNLSSGVNNYVYTLTTFNGDLIAGGDFDTAGGIPTNYVAKWSSPTGINELAYSYREVRVYPNPSSGVFTISITGLKNKAQVEIYNVLGEQVYDETLNPTAGGQGDEIVDLSEKPSGIYQYRITSDKGDLIGSGKLIKE